MPRETNWTDYANLAANVAQLSRLGDIRDGVAQMQLAQMTEQKCVEHEDRFRQVAFQIESALQNAKSETNDPATALVLLKMLRKTMEEKGVDPSAFRQFADKDRVRQIQINFETTLEEFELKVSDRLNEVNLCWRYMIEMRPLLDLIRFQEGMATREQDLKALAEKASTLEGHTARSVLGYIITVVIALGAVVTTLVLNGTQKQDALMTGGLIGGAVGATIGLAIRAVLTGGGHDTELLERKIQELRHRLDKYSPESLALLQQRFGPLTLEQCECLKQERWAHIERVLPPKAVPAKFVIHWCSDRHVPDEDVNPVTNKMVTA